MSVLIAGGGIGGLALALSLHQIGVEAKVFESAPVVKPLVQQASALRKQTNSSKVNSWTLVD